MALSKGTEKKVREYVETKFLKKINEYLLDEEDSAKPFQYALFTKKGYLVKSFMHGTETSMGSWHEEIARIIAKDKFVKAEKLEGSNKLKGEVSASAITKIEEILSDLDGRKRVPKIDVEKKDVFKVSKQGIKSGREQTVDLFLENKEGEEFYFEIKGPKANKNEMRAAKRDLFEIYAMRALEGKDVHIYLGMYYNTYHPEQYKRWTALRFFELNCDFLVGKDFWDFLGGEGAYEQIVKIYEDVGAKVRPVLDKKLKDVISDL